MYVPSCHIRHTNPEKIHPERITQKIKTLLTILIMTGFGFLFEKKILTRLKCNICINVFCYESKLVFPIYISNQKFENSMNFLLIIDDDKSYYVYIKDFDRFMFHKTKNKNKKYFFKSCLQCFSSENVLTKHKEVCLGINGSQSVRLEKRTIGFTNHFKQIPVPFKVYADFECNLKTVESYEGSYLENIKITFLVVLLTKSVTVFRGENAAYEFIEKILKVFEYYKKVRKNTLIKI